MQRHPFHLVDASPWPFLVSLTSFSITVGAVTFFHYFLSGLEQLIKSLIIFTIFLLFWFRDVVREGTFLGLHTENVMVALRLGFLLFILSEIMLFFSFFWAFFHSSLAPSIAIGSVWPPYKMVLFNPWELSLLNTFILLTSGATITLAHLSLINNRISTAIISFLATLFLALFFTFIQAYEYLHAPFSLSDGIYGSLFFMLTGFHGAHVIIGTIFIFVQFLRYLSGHFSPKEQFGFEASSWYWHFVDIVWIFVFAIVYVWSQNQL